MAINSSRELRRAYDKKRYWDNHEKEKERVKIKMRKFRKRNPLRIKEIQRKFYELHPEARAIHNKTWRDKNFQNLKEYHKEYYVNNKEFMRRKQLAKIYGLEVEEYDALFELQEGKCAICGKHQVDLPKRLFIDHNHDTGQVRALLCHKCNAGLGMFKDRIELIEKATNYLKKYND